MRTRTEQVAAIRADQRLWRELAAEVGPQRYTAPGPMGQWTFADLAGHLLGWRNRTIARLEAAATGGPEPVPPWPAGLEDDDSSGTESINDWIRRQDAGRPPEKLVAAYDASYDRLIAAIQAIPEARQTDPDAFPWIDGPLLAADFTRHLHDEHLTSLRAWLDQSSHSPGDVP